MEQAIYGTALMNNKCVSEDGSWRCESASFEADESTLHERSYWSDESSDDEFDELDESEDSKEDFEGDFF